GDLPDPAESGLVSVVVPVREIQPEDVDARANEGVERLGRVAGGSYRRDDPRVAHVGLSLQSDPACAKSSRHRSAVTSKRSTDRSIRCSRAFAPRALPPGCRWSNPTPRGFCAAW